VPLSVRGHVVTELAGFKNWNFKGRCTASVNEHRWIEPPGNTVGALGAHLHTYTRDAAVRVSLTATKELLITTCIFM
jgi:hypothetical protein